MIIDMNFEIFDILKLDFAFGAREDHTIRADFRDINHLFKHVNFFVVFLVLFNQIKVPVQN